MTSAVIGFAVARRTSRSNLVKGWLDSGHIDIYTADRPATADTAIDSQTKLVVISLKATSGSVSNGVWTCDPPSPQMVIADGNVAWARAYDSNDAVICDMDAGLVGSGAALILDAINLVSGGYVIIQSLTITEG